MPVETVTRCTKCKRTDCDGNRYDIIYTHRYSLKVINEELCTYDIRNCSEILGKKYYVVMYGVKDNQLVEIINK